MTKINLLKSSLVYICLIISISFYFVVNVDHFFSWWVPDELNSIYTGIQSTYYQCVKHYYLYTTINRITSDLLICTTSFFSSFGKTPYLGLISIKVIFSLALPFSVAYFLYKKIYLSFSGAISAGFILAGLISVVNYQSDTMLYSVDMAIYTSANSLLLLMLSLDLNKYSSKKFIIYITALFFSACSHEVVLALCGFIILEAIYYLYKEVQFKKIIIVILTYLLASLSYFITPGYNQRLNTWPVSSTFTESIVYMLGTFKYIFNHINNFSLIFLIILFIGFFYSYSNNKINKINFIITTRALIYSILYLIVISTLVGFSKSLWSNIDGDIAPRMRFGFLLLLAISMFLFSFNLGVYFKKFVKFSYNGNYLASYLSIGFTILSLILIHPDLFLFKASINNYVITLKTNINNIDYINNNLQSQQNNNLFSSDLGHYFYRRDITPNREKIGKYFALDRELFFSSNNSLNRSEIHLRINSLINKESERYFGLRSAWLQYLFTIYNRDYYDYTKFYSKCKWINYIDSNSVCGLNSKDFNLDNIYIKYQYNLILANPFKTTIERSDSWLIIRDDDTNGEHYIFTDKTLLPGTYSLSIKGESSEIKNYIYLITQKSQVLVPWTKKTKRENYYYVYGPSPDLELLYSQFGIDSSGLNFINILFKVNKEVDMTIRYQHSAETTMYKGNSYQYSKIFNVILGHVEHK